MESLASTVKYWVGGGNGNYFGWSGYCYGGNGYYYGQQTQAFYSAYFTLWLIGVISVFSTFLIIFLIFLIISHFEKSEKPEEEKEKRINKPEPHSITEELKKIREEQAEIAKELKTIHEILLHDTSTMEDVPKENVSTAEAMINLPIRRTEGEFLFCPACGEKLPPGVLFCPECGEKL